jgi:hypothetical protein
LLYSAFSNYFLLQFFSTFFLLFFPSAIFHISPDGFHFTNVSLYEGLVQSAGQSHVKITPQGFSVGSRDPMPL